MSPRLPIPALLTAALLVTAAGASSAQTPFRSARPTTGPTITSLNASEFPLSGRVAISGSGFGSGGEVSIAGIGAWTGTWTDTRVVAFVPEATPLGSVQLKITPQGSPSASVLIDVVPRQPSGRIRWSFEADGENLWFRPALAPDGTLHVQSTSPSGCLVYAIAPDGGLKWIHKLSGFPFPYGPPHAGPDGAVYQGSIYSAYRIGRDGKLDWEFYSPGGDGIHIVPHTGPDGLLYGAYQWGIGAYSLDPQTGQLLWSNEGVPEMGDWMGNLGTEAVFGRAGAGQPLDRYYIPMEWTADLHAMTLDGQQLWAVGVGHAGAQPAVGSDGTIYIPAFLAYYVAALDPADGSVLWTFHPGGSQEIPGIEVGPDDTLYYTASGKVQALNTSNQTLRWSYQPYYVFDAPALSPDGSMLVVTGVPTYGDPGFIEGLSTNNGHMRWHVDLPGDPYPGFRALARHRPRISADSSTAYVSTATVADGSPSPDPRSYLLAVDTRP